MSLRNSRSRRLATIGATIHLLWLAGCSGTGGHSPYYSTDRPPTRDVDVTAIPDAVPRPEPITKAGNKSPYTVMGKTYRILPSSHGYRQRGVASWYGSKFHGQKTSNGETYDMFAMSAAHKTLPIPAYVKVTNQENGRSVIVRVNDRGPFLHNRLIDLSYAAAKKLGYTDKGTAVVEVEAMDPYAWRTDGRVAALPVAPRQTAQGGGGYLQVGAFSSAQSAQRLQARVQEHTRYPVQIRSGESGPSLLYKVIIGPIIDAAEMLALRRLLEQRERLSPFFVQD